MATARASTDVADVHRLLRHSARRELERLAAERAAVHPNEVAIRIVYSHFHVAAVRGRREELILLIADYVRELRAAGAEQHEP